MTVQESLQKASQEVSEPIMFGGWVVYVPVRGGRTSISCPMGYQQAVSVSKYNKVVRAFELACEGMCDSEHVYILEEELTRTMPKGDWRKIAREYIRKFKGE